MITRRVRVQLTIFSIMATIACSLIFFHYAKVPAIMGVGQIHVTAEFSSGSGLYPQANVTYRGVTVGKVTAVDLTPEGVLASLRISRDAGVPVGVEAHIKSVSAIGEQYVDLIPVSAGGERLVSGDGIPLERTRVPIPVATVLDDVDGLLAAVPGESLEIVLDEAQQGFEGLGPELTRLNRNAQAFIKEAAAAYPETHQLIVDAETLFDTQIDTSSDIRGWTDDLAGLTAELRRNDSSIRAVLSNVPPAANEVSDLLDELSQPVHRLITTADVTADVTSAYVPGIRQILVVLPMMAAVNIANMPPSRGGQFGLAFKTIVNYPGNCSTGWPTADEPLGSRSSAALEDMEFPQGAYCKIPQSDPRVTRGTRNLQCFEPGSPTGRRAATIEQCEGDGYTTTDPGKPQITIPNPLAPVGNLILDHLNGTVEAGSSTKEDSWTNLMLGPLKLK